MALPCLTMRLWSVAVVLVLPTSLLAQARVCDVHAYGAVDDGSHDSTAAIQAAIDSCSSSGGGTVLLRRYTSGVYVAGSLFLASDLVFLVDLGTTLLGTASKSFGAYPEVYTRVAGTMQFGRASLLNGARCNKIAFNASAIGDQCQEWNKLKNVTLTGQGTINGNGDTGWYNATYANDRPTLLGLLWIDGLTISDLTLTNPPFWTVHPTFCNNVYIHDLHIETDGPNTDGIDPDSSSNVLVERCYVSTGDDCIAIKSGKDADGRAVGLPTRNVTIRDMVFGKGHGISIGSEMSGDVLDIYFNNLTLDGTDRGVRIKSQAGRGGIVANVTYANMRVYNVAEVISVSMFYSSGAVGLPPVFENFTIENIVAAHISQDAGSFDCLSQSPCRGLVVRNVTVDTYAKGFECSNAFGTSKDVSPPICLASAKPV